MRDCGLNMAITSFSGDYRFLSNFFVLPSWIEYDGYKWATTEQAYQAAKSDFSMREINYTLMCEDRVTPGEAKRMGQKLEMRPDWDQIKIAVMTKINEEKFEKNPDLMELLLATKDQELIEGNTWGDTFWGQCPIGKGSNYLGKILMGIRDSIV